jgi:pimeloyl-ACP methyl ester carboxylesterase
MDQIFEALKNAPIEVPGNREPVTMREVYGEDASVFAWLAANLYQSDPDMLTALLERFEVTTTGYEMDAVLPAIRCPVLLLQADPAAGGLMADMEIEQAIPMLARPGHVRLHGESHALHHVHPEPVVAALRGFFGSF